MIIYFAGSIRGGRDLQTHYAALVTHLKHAGHVVLTEHVASGALETDEGDQSDAEIYAQDIEWLDACDIVIAEVTVPSLGVGYEIGYALHQAHKPVLCLCQQNTNLSAMIMGNPHPNLQIRFYRDMADAQRAIERFMN
jgi:nucleoside 2-deoxyribosyltransferase